MAVWIAVKQRPREFAERAAIFFTEAYHSQDAYLRVREEFNNLVDRFERAVRLPYLNKFGFNGLFRVNRSGVYNTPYGRPSRLPVFPWEEVEAAAAKTERSSILNGGFAAALEQAGVGDVVYCDPPYLASAAGHSFIGYTAEPFGLRQHRELLVAAVQAVSRGAHVLISNHDTPEVRDLYRGREIYEVTAFRSISAKANSRGTVAELVAALPLRQ